MCAHETSKKNKKEKIEKGTQIFSTIKGWFEYDAFLQKRKERKTELKNIEGSQKFIIKLGLE